MPEKFPTIEIDEFIVMPNHFHGIIVIVGAIPCGRPKKDRPIVGATPCGRPENGRPNKGHPHGDAPTLGDIIDWFKTMTTNEYIRNVKSNGWQPFPGRFWQRNYFEHIIRNNFEMNRIREYIYNNLSNWTDDEYFMEVQT